MKNTLILFLFFLIQSNSYSFETGRYRGISSDGQEACDLDIVQNAQSITINTLDCVNETLGRRVTAEPKEWAYGITKKYFKEFKMTMTHNISLNRYLMNYSNEKKSDSYDEELIYKGNKTAHFKFSITDKNIFYPWFDLDLTLLEEKI
jgi:hypothetical protein